MTSLNLDVIGAILVGLFAMCFFKLYLISSPKRSQWYTPPATVRKGLLLSGVLLTFRSAQLWDMSPGDGGLGHVNPLAILVTLVLTYTMGAVTVWLSRKVLPEHGWDRVNHTAAMIHAHPDQRPVMLTEGEVVEVANMLGVNAVQANAGPEELRK